MQFVACPTTVRQTFFYAAIAEFLLSLILVPLRIFEKLKLVVVCTHTNISTSMYNHTIGPYSFITSKHNIHTLLLKKFLIKRINLLDGPIEKLTVKKKLLRWRI
jgi:hypothetical protein